MPDLSSLNPLAILVVALVSAMPGAAWYSSAMFGKACLAALGKSQGQLGSPNIAFDLGNPG